MAFLQQYGIIIDPKTKSIHTTCEQGKVDLVVDAVLKEHFRTGVMPAADRQTYVDLALAYAREFEEDECNEEELRQIAESGAEKALDPHYRFVYRFVFNLGIAAPTLEFEGNTYRSNLTLFVEWRQYNGASQIDNSDWYRHPQTMIRTDLANGFLIEQRPPMGEFLQDTNRSAYEIPTVLWGMISGTDTNDHIMHLDKNAEGKLCEYTSGTKIVSPIEARHILADNFSLFERYACSLSNVYSLRRGLYGELPNDIPRSDPFKDPPAWSKLAESRYLDTWPQNPGSGNSTRQPEYCTRPSSSYPEMPVEVPQNQQVPEQRCPC